MKEQGRDDVSMPMQWRDYPAFYTNPFVRAIENDPKWTVSTKDKMPIDMDHLIFNHKIVGLKEYPKGVYTLPTLLAECDRIKLNPQNHAYKMESLECGYVVLDIEPKCPEELRAVFMKTPYLYAETSMSGKGLHLVYPLPRDILDRYPIAKKKRTMREEHGYYEFLLDHFITFTRHVLPPCQDPDVSIEPYFEQLCALQKDNTRIEEFDIGSEKPEDIPNEDNFLAIMNKYDYGKTLADFNDDHSRYEFGMASFYHRRLASIIQGYNASLKQGGMEPHDYTVKEIVWMIYETIVDKLEWREKHDTFRSGMPLLLYRVYCVIAINGKFPAKYDKGAKPAPKLTEEQVDAIIKDLRENPV